MALNIARRKVAVPIYASHTARGLSTPIGPYTKYLAVAEEAARKAGAIIRKEFHSPHAIQRKIDDRRSLVTATDTQCEELIFNILRSKYPDHCFVGEESTTGKVKLTHEPTWLVDPLDGTTNFVHHYPNVCCSIGLSIGRSMKVGVVYNPLTDELYHAMCGGGAYVNNRKMRVSTITHMRDALVATSFPYHNTPREASKMLHAALYGVQAIRRSGSAALDLCYVANGSLDMYYEAGIRAWDMAAGSLLIQEAGGVAVSPVGTPLGKPLDITGRNILCGNPEIVRHMLNVLEDIRDKVLADHDMERPKPRPHTKMVHVSHELADHRD